MTCQIPSDHRPDVPPRIAAGGDPFDESLWGEYARTLIVGTSACSAILWLLRFSVEPAVFAMVVANILVLGMKDEQVMVGSLGAESITEVTEVAEPSWAGWSDWVGMIASIGCAVHCAAMPFVIAYLPALGLGFLADEGFHQWMAVGCFVIALLAFVPGLRKHRRLTPVIIGSVGLVMITTAAFGFAGECCASCQSDARTADSGAADLSGSAVSLASAEVCTEACCADAANKPAANQNVASKDVEAGVANDGAVAGPRVALAGVSLAALPTQSSAFSQLISRIVPWLTSIGGIVLVVAHLLNRRYGCLCGCCDADVSKVSS